MRRVMALGDFQIPDVFMGFDLDHGRGSPWTRGASRDQGKDLTLTRDGSTWTGVSLNLDQGRVQHGPGTGPILDQGRGHSWTRDGAQPGRGRLILIQGRDLIWSGDRAHPGRQGRGTTWTRAILDPGHASSWTRHGTLHQV